MPSPFPGMDPFIEGQSWPDFHARMIGDVATALAPQLDPNYFAQIEERLFLETEPERRYGVQPDVTVLRDKPGRRSGGGMAVLEPSNVVKYRIRPQARERYLTIVHRQGHRVVTVIEVLSPANKRPGSDSLRAYEAKRHEFLESNVSMVEIDLLRGGARDSTEPVVSDADYCILVGRARNRPICEVYAAKLREPLPRVPIPLLDPDPDAVIDLQDVFAKIYDRARYSRLLDYALPVEPPFSDADAAWVAERLKASATP
ncbi:MAG TPA: DUF4058 family protein [Planctomycetia bacterium]|nr:DUF4058 family protein [Planctomycetia bacterium]